MKIILGLWGLKKMLFDVYLCTAYRCGNMELGPVMGGKSVPPTSLIWLPVRLSSSNIHLQKWKLNRRLWCKSQAITLCGVESRIKPSNHSHCCSSSSYFVPQPLDRWSVFQHVIAANNFPYLHYLGPSRRGRFRELPAWFVSLWCVKSSGGNISITQQDEKKSLWIH